MKFLVTGKVTLTFTEHVEAENDREAMRKVMDTDLKDLCIDSEKTEIDECSRIFLPGEKP